jgi:hypothetical protein
MTKAHAFLLLGGLEGIDGFVDSAGMEALIPMLSAIGVPTTMHTWDKWQDALPEMRALPADCKTIVIGYSGGGSRATWVANSARWAVNRLERSPIHLMVLYDPSPSWQMEPVGQQRDPGTVLPQPQPDDAVSIRLARGRCPHGR